MSLSTDILHELCYGSSLRAYVYMKAIIGFIYLQVKEQSQERYEYVVNYDQSLHFGSNRLHTALFNLLTPIIDDIYRLR